MIHTAVVWQGPSALQKKNLEWCKDVLLIQIFSIQASSVGTGSGTTGYT